MPAPNRKLVARSRAENTERAYAAASRRTDRSIEARMSSALKASKIHKLRTGHSLIITERILLNDQAFEEEEDSLMKSYREHISRIKAQSAIHVSVSRDSLIQQASWARQQEALNVSDCVVFENGGSVDSDYLAGTGEDISGPVSFGNKDTELRNKVGDINKNGRDEKNDRGTKIAVPTASQPQLSLQPKATEQQPQQSILPDLSSSHDPTNRSEPCQATLSYQNDPLLFEPVTSLQTTAAVSSDEVPNIDPSSWELCGNGSSFCCCCVGDSSNRAEGREEMDGSSFSWSPLSLLHSPSLRNPTLLPVVASPDELPLPFIEELWDASQVEGRGNAAAS